MSITTVLVSVFLIPKLMKIFQNSKICTFILNSQKKLGGWEGGGHDPYSRKSHFFRFNAPKKNVL